MLALDETLKDSIEYTMPMKTWENWDYSKRYNRVPNKNTHN
jgi:hypothetical protein